MDNWTEEEFQNYVKEVNAAYWEEISEIQEGIHPLYKEGEE